MTNWRGEPVGRALVVRDVTDLVRHQQRLQVLNRVLRHDIRDGMNIILGSVEQVGTDTPDAQRAARTIRQEGNDIVAMSNKARRFESLFDGEEVATATVDLTDVVDRVADELAQDNPDAEIRWDRPEPTPIRANDHLELAVRNVAENAVEHNDTASPRIDISVTDEGDTVALRVADDGPGLPALERQVIERGRETPLEHSRGIGLWLAAWVVEETGGEIRFGENDPRGTVVTLRFPAAEPEDGVTVDTTAPQSAASPVFQD